LELEGYFDSGGRSIPYGIRLEMGGVGGDDVW